MAIRIRYRNSSGQLTGGFVRIFSIGFTVLSMLAVALLSALITLRFAIHMGEVGVPNVSGMSLAEAAKAAADKKLNLTVESRFYSTTVPAGLVLSQSPAAGERVRKLWHMRVTQSMGPQRIAIPDTVGMNERDAAAAVRRASMEVGTVAHLVSPGPSGIVLAQTPPANAEGVDKPEVSLLVSQAESTAPRAYVMPDVTGLSFTAASAKVREINARLTALLPQAAAAPKVDGVAPTPLAPMQPAGVILSQTPVAGSRVFPTDTLRVRMSAAATSAPSAVDASATGTAAATPAASSAAGGTPAATPKPLAVPKPGAPAVRPAAASTAPPAPSPR